MPFSGSTENVHAFDNGYFFSIFAGFPQFRNHEKYPGAPGNSDM
jgi:hypothetical protein